jgi:deoxyribose-phosphate aldolase
MNYANLIDDTNLHADAVEADIISLCNEAKEIGAASVCVNPDYIELSKNLLKGSKVKVCTVIGFPLGSMTTESKVFEAKDAINKGADEVDMVINISKLKDHKDDYVRNEVKAIKEACGEHILKVILECCLLTDKEIERACVLCKEAKADFVKTSTGFSTHGATIKDVALMRKTVGPEMGVKAAGGVRTPEDLKAMVDAGANRIGASHGKNLVK